MFTLLVLFYLCIALHMSSSDALGIMSSTASQNAPSQSLEKPLKIGLISDIQFADIPDGSSYSGVPRYYRHALDATQEAAEMFEASEVDVVVNLGDTIDGQASDDETALDRVLSALSAYSGRTLHAYGNHCLYNHDRNVLQEKLGIPFVREESQRSDEDEDEHSHDLVGYYSYELTDTVKLIFLDAYDDTVHRPVASKKHQTAKRTLQKHNSKNYNDGLENSPEGLEGLARRFVAFNGGVGDQQLRWLEEELQTSRKLSQKVLVFSHTPIHPASAHPVCLLWNYQAVLDVLGSYTDVVMASFAGHTHKFGYSYHNNVHYRVLEAVLESPPPQKTFAILSVYEDRLQLDGFGECESATYPI